MKDIHRVPIGAGSALGLIASLLVMLNHPASQLSVLYSAPLVVLMLACVTGFVSALTATPSEDAEDPLFRAELEAKEVANFRRR